MQRNDDSQGGKCSYFFRIRKRVFLLIIISSYHIARIILNLKLKLFFETKYFFSNNFNIIPAEKFANIKDHRAELGPVRCSFVFLLCQVVSASAWSRRKLQHPDCKEIVVKGCVFFFCIPNLLCALLPSCT